MAFDIDQIFQETNGGLDIIRWYVKDIDSYVGTSKHFRMREDDITESCSLKLTDDRRYIVTDFGAGRKSRNAIEIVRNEERCTYGEALKIIVTRHDLSFGSEVQSLYTAKFRKEDAEPSEAEGTWTFEHLEKWPDSWIEIIFSRYVIEDVDYRHQHIKDDAERKQAVYEYLALVLSNQNWHPLKLYSKVKERKKTTVESQEYYPIITIEEESVIKGKKTKWKKIYQPKNKDKKFRFMYYNGSDKDFLHGLAQTKKRLEKLRDKAAKENKEDKTFDRSKVKHKRIFFSTGGSDAVNKIALGYECVYGASEYFKLTVDILKDLLSIAYDVFTCPDLDATGQRENLKLCLTPTHELYLDIKTVDLPADLRKEQDQYRRGCKDVRDYLNYFNAMSFRNLVKMAKPLRFWDEHQALDKEGSARFKFGKPIYQYNISVERLLNFLIKNGFGKFETMPEVIEYVHVNESIVKVVKADQIKAFVLNFLRNRYMSEDLIDAAHKSTLLTDTHFAQLPELQLNFQDSWMDCQLMFFPNKFIRIDRTGISELKGSTAGHHVWESKIVQKPFKRLLDPMFEITKEGNKFQLKINNKECLFLRFLTQISRVHWKIELEDRLDELPDSERNDYIAKNKFNIAGPLLSAEQQYDQELHLMSKLYALGYLVHRFKNPTRSLSVIAMDNEPSPDGPQGGTGKSVFFEAVEQVRQMVTLDGKNEKLFDDSHALEQVNRSTDILYIDDAAEKFQFERLFSMVTGNMTVNPKGKTRVSLAKAESPKITISTNYTPGKLNGSTLRRILFLGMTDYFHDNKLGKFREERTPIDDLGKALFTEFTDDDWNNFLNLMIQCCHLYLTSPKIESPMVSIMERNLLAEMTINFVGWADIYFDKSANTRDVVIPTHIAMADFMRFSNLPKYTPQAFNTKIKLYAKYKHWILNPEDLLGKSDRFIKNLPIIEFDNKSKQWIKQKGVKSQAVFYFQTEDEDGNWKSLNPDKVYDPTIDPNDLPSPATNSPKLPWDQ